MPTNILLQNDSRLNSVANFLALSAPAYENIYLLSVFEQHNSVTLNLAKLSHGLGFSDSDSQSFDLVTVDDDARFKSLANCIESYMSHLTGNIKFGYYLTIDDSNSYYFTIARQMRISGARIGVVAHAAIMASPHFTIAHDYFTSNRYNHKQFGRLHKSVNVYRAGLPEKVLELDYERVINDKYENADRVAIVALFGTHGSSAEHDTCFNILNFQLALASEKAHKIPNAQYRLKFVYRPHPYSSEDLATSLGVLSATANPFPVIIYSHALSELLKVADLALFGHASSAIYDCIIGGVPIFQSPLQRPGEYHGFTSLIENSFAELATAALNDRLMLRSLVSKQYKFLVRNTLVGKLSTMSICATLRHNLRNPLEVVRQR